MNPFPVEYGLYTIELSVVRRYPWEIVQQTFRQQRDIFGKFAIYRTDMNDTVHYIVQYNKSINSVIINVIKKCIIICNM